MKWKQIKKCSAIKRPPVSIAAGNMNPKRNALISQKEGVPVKEKTIGSVTSGRCAIMGKTPV